MRLILGVSGLSPLVMGIPVSGFRTSDVCLPPQPASFAKAFEQERIYPYCPARLSEKRDDQDDDWHDI